jgi:hypothetical protein
MSSHVLNIPERLMPRSGILSGTKNNDMGISAAKIRNVLLLLSLKESNMSKLKPLTSPTLLINVLGVAVIIGCARHWPYETIVGALLLINANLLFGLRHIAELLNTIKRISVIACMSNVEDILELMESDENEMEGK